MITLQLDSLAALTMEGRSLIVDPADAALNAIGHWVVTDRGDKVIKVLNPAGGDVMIVGAPGHGPGEFRALVSGGSFNEQDGIIFGYDMISNTLSLFNQSGSHIDDVKIQSPTTTPIAFLRPFDNEFLLASGWISPSGEPAIQLFDREGRHIRSFLKLGSMLKDLPPQTMMNMGVVATGRDGLVFSAIFGHDTIFVHDTHGRLHASGRLRLEHERPILRLPDLIRGNGGSLRNSKGDWIHQGSLAVRSIVALGNGMAAVQFAPVDFGGEHDLLSDGGPVVLVAMHGAEVQTRATLHVAGALLGEDGAGNGLVVGLRGTELQIAELLRLRIEPQGLQP